MDSITLSLVGLGLLLAYNIALAIYRLTFHPLARFPGPKFAAVSGWYEVHHDIVRHGQFIWHIRDLHDHYGPIVRITPDELHILDSEYYDEIYAPSAKKRDKWDRFVLMTGNIGMTFSTASHDQHRIRRSVLNPFFSKRSIANNEAQIREKVEHLCRRLEVYSMTRDVLRLDGAYSALTMDIIAQYAFGESYNHLDEADWKENWRRAIVDGSANAVVLRLFPWVFPVLMSIPMSVVKRLDPESVPFLEWPRNMEKEVNALKEMNARGKKAEGTIFQALLDSDLPASDKTVERLTQEAMNIVGAGFETTGKALSFVTFFVYSDPEVLRKLRKEIEACESKSGGRLDLIALEKLAYLTACITEGLRMSTGVTARSPRVAHEPTQYQQWTIPAGTPVSQSNYFVNHDPKIFPEPLRFHPERWIEANEKGIRLERYMVSFSRGSRACVGINLAWAELYLTLAHVVRRFDMTPFETIAERDVVIARDCFLGAPRADSQGIRMKVSARQ